MAKRKARQVSPEAAPSSPSESSEGPTGSESSSGSDVTESEDDSPSSSSGVSDEVGCLNSVLFTFSPSLGLGVVCLLCGLCCIKWIYFELRRMRCLVFRL